jgi:hypothetical protein
VNSNECEIRSSLVWRMLAQGQNFKLGGAGWLEAVEMEDAVHVRMRAELVKETCSCSLACVRAEKR